MNYGASHHLLERVQVQSSGLKVLVSGFWFLVSGSAFFEKALAMDDPNQKPETRN
jgi:hypothetical protein